MNIAIALFIVLVVLNVKLASSDCCKSPNYIVKHECAGVPNEKRIGRIRETRQKACSNKICMDGTVVPEGLCCGHGSCNLFCCYCEDGCRSNAENSRTLAIQIFKEKYQLTVAEEKLIIPSL